METQNKKKIREKRNAKDKLSEGKHVKIMVNIRKWLKWKTI